MDAEYFHPLYIEMEKILEQTSKNPNFSIVALQDISTKIRKGIFSILKTEYRPQGVPFIRVSNIKNLMIHKEDLTYISEERNEKEKKTCLYPNDIVVVKGGVGVGEVGIIPSHMPMVNISQDVIGISIRSGKAFPEYVCTYLASKFGRSWFTRNRSIVAQPHLELLPVREMPIPLVSFNRQQEIAGWIKEAIEEYRKAEGSYAEAERLLNAILGFETYEAERKKAFQVYFSEIEESDGWNAEQHLPEYSDLVEKVQKGDFPLTFFGQVVTISKKTLNPREQPERTFRYVELANISESFGDIEEYSEFLGHEAPSRARMLLSKGDILIPYLSGSFDKVAIVTEKHDGMIGSTGFYVVRSKVYDSWFLLALLRNEVFQAQLRQKVAGTIMQSISEDSLKGILLPIIPSEKQTQIAEMMKNSHASKRRSKETVQKTITHLENSLEKPIAD
jgi:restriction endonuclease S subunit